MDTGGIAEPSASADVWWVHPHEVAPSVADGLLTEADHRALARVPEDGRSGSRRCVRALLRLVAARLLDCSPHDITIGRRCPRCGEGDHGRPFVEGASFGLSSAVSDRVAVVASGGPMIGVDVVRRGDGDAAVASAPAVLLPDALAALDKMPRGLRDEAALAAVAQVEAYAKANGLALSALAGTVAVSLDPSRPRIAVPGASVAIRVDPDDRHVAVLVIDPSPAAVRVRHATQLFNPVVRSI